MYKNRSRGIVLSSSKGFTLIELLVVIAIIGILSAVVLASLNTARSKGQDAAVQSDLNTVQVQAELYYGGAGNNTYGATQAWVVAGGCAAGVGTMWADTTIQNAMAQANSSNGAGLIGCASTATTYVAAAALVAANGGVAYQCVDSTGTSKTVNAAFPAGAISVCP